jgi:hypothetical protein
MAEPVSFSARRREIVALASPSAQLVEEVPLRSILPLASNRYYL